MDRLGRPLTSHRSRSEVEPRVGFAAVIRRLAVLAGALLAATSLSSCATFEDSDTAAVSVNGHELAADQLEVLADGASNGDAVRSAMSAWTQIEVLGGDTEGITSFAALNDRLQETMKTLATNHFDEGRASYEQGLSGSPVACLAVIPLDPTVPSAPVLAEFEDGTSFADLAAQYSSIESLALNGGLLTDADGNECFDPIGLNAELITGLADAEATVGTPVSVTFAGQELIVLLRPFDELSSDSKALLSLPAAQVEAATLFAAADVDVASRYGRWDAASSSVLPLGEG